MYKSKMYAHKINSTFNHFENSLEILQLSVYGNHPCFEVKVREVKKDEESLYWAWKDFKEKKYRHIFPTKNQVEMCFPYGSKIKEEKGEGKLVNLLIEEVKEIKNP